MADPVVLLSTGDVVGPNSSTDGTMALFDGTSGKKIKGNGAVVTTQGLALLDDVDATANRATIGLNQVNNTSDINKPISTATQTALDAKQPTLGFPPVQQGTGVGQSPNLIKIGWSAGNVVKVTVDNLDLGQVWTANDFAISNYRSLDNGAFTSTVQIKGSMQVVPSSLIIWNDAAMSVARFYMSHDDSTLSLVARGDASDVQAYSISRSNGRMNFGIRPTFVGQTPWDTNNFNPNTKASVDSIDVVGLAGNDPNQPYVRQASTGNLVSLQRYRAPNTASLGVSGWSRCGDTGEIIQWVELVIGDLPTYGIYNITWPMAFPNAFLNARTSLKCASSSNTSRMNATYSAGTTSGCVVRLDEWAADIQQVTLIIEARGY